MSKNIWILHHYADPPDGHWTGTFDLYKFLAKKGHRITILSSSFSHYSREDPRLGAGEKYREQIYEGMRFVFVKTAPYTQNNWRRALNMVSYAVRSYLWGIRQKKAPDVIVTATPHPFCSYAALRLAKKFRAPLLLELHDLWLEYLLDTGMVAKINPAYALVHWLETSCYRHARRILMLWPKMDLYLARYGVPQDKTVWTPLGVDFETLKSIAPKPPTSGQPFVAICTGSFGPASNVWEIVESARILKDQGEEQIRFVLVGSGSEKEKLVQFAEKNHLTNVEFRGIVPKEKIRQCLGEADVCIAGLPDIPSYRKYGTIPTKLMDYLTSNRPTLFITSIEDNLVKQARAGLTVPPNSPSLLAEAVLKLSRMTPEERTRMGQNGIAYMKEHHNLKKLAERVEDLL